MVPEKGEFTNESLPEIFNQISDNYDTGKLILYSGNERKTIAFDKGKITFESSGRSRRQNIGRLLVGKGKVTQEQLLEALDEQQATGGLIGKIFVQKEYVSEEVIQEILKYQLEEDLFEVFAWNNGRYEFYEEENPYEENPDNTMTITLDIKEYLSEVSEKGRELNAFIEKLGSTKKIFVQNPEFVNAWKEHGPDENQVKVLELADGTRNIEDVVVESYFGKIKTIAFIVYCLENQILQEVAFDTLKAEADQAYEAKEFTSLLARKLGAILVNPDLSDEDRIEYKRRAQNVISTLNDAEAELISSRIGIEPVKLKPPVPDTAAKKKKMIIAAVAVLLVVIGGVAAFFVIRGRSAQTVNRKIQKAAAGGNKDPGGAVEKLQKLMAMIPGRYKQKVQGKIDGFKKRIAKEIHKAEGEADKAVKQGNYVRANRLLSTAIRRFKLHGNVTKLMLKVDNVRNLIKKKQKQEEGRAYQNFLKDLQTALEEGKLTDLRRKATRSRFSKKEEVAALVDKVKGIEKEVASLIEEGNRLLKSSTPLAAEKPLKKAIKKGGDLPAVQKAGKLIKEISEKLKQGWDDFSSARNEMSKGDQELYQKKLTVIAETYPGTDLCDQVVKEKKRVETYIRGAADLFRKIASADSVAGFLLKKKLLLEYPLSKEARKTKAVVTLRIFPYGAFVSVNKTRRSDTVLKLEYSLTDLSYSIHVSKKGFQPWKKDMLLEKQDSPESICILKKIPCWTKKNKKPSGISPIFYGNRLLVSQGGKVICLDQNTGSLMWMFQVNVSKPFILKPDGRRFIVSNPDFWDVKAAPLICGEDLIFSSLNSQVVRVSLRDGSQKWKYVTPFPVTRKTVYATVALKNNKPYICVVDDGGHFACIDFQTGKKAFTEKLSGFPLAQPVVMKSNVYVVDCSGRLSCFNLLREKCTAQIDLRDLETMKRVDMFAQDKCIIIRKDRYLKKITTQGKTLLETEISNPVIFTDKKDKALFLAGKNIQIVDLKSFKSKAISIPTFLRVTAIAAANSEGVCVCAPDYGLVLLSLTDGTIRCGYDFAADAGVIGTFSGKTLAVTDPSGQITLFK